MTDRLRRFAGALLPVAVPAIALVAAGCGSGTHDKTQTYGEGLTVPTGAQAVSVSRDPLLARLGLPAVPPDSPLPGYMMIADRDNNRVIIVSPGKRILWQFPVSRGGGSGSQLSQPDDAFVSPNGRYISTNQEFADSIAMIALSRHPRIDRLAIRPPGRSGGRTGVPGAPRRRLSARERRDPARGHHQLPCPVAEPGQAGRTSNRHCCQLRARSAALVERSEWGYAAARWGRACDRDRWLGRSF